jgi:hypothetical protein
MVLLLFALAHLQVRVNFLLLDQHDEHFHAFGLATCTASTVPPSSLYKGLCC